MLVKLLDQQHDDYRDCKVVWQKIDLLSRGGHALEAQAERFLMQRPKELSDIYRSRRMQFTQQNILGTGIGWYQSALFPEDPQVLIRRDEAELAGADADFWTGFQKNCDRRGTKFSNLMADTFETAALFGTAWVLTDLPRQGEFKTRAQQKAAGALNPYIGLFNPQDVTNWSEDEAGNLDWVVFSSTVTRQSFGGTPKIVDRWCYFDKTTYKVFEAVREDANQKATDAPLVIEGPHALADLGRVPVRRVAVPRILWLGDRVYLQVLNHLNMDNSFGWALFMANMAVPVITGDYKDSPTVSETALINLETGSTFEWSEPKGTSFEHSATRLSSLREEIYRQMYLQAQGRSSKASASAQSGYSKEMDMAPSKDILNRYGEMIREAMVNVLTDVQAARNPKDELQFSVRGFDFADSDTEQDIAEATGALGLDIQSDTYRKEVQKGICRRVLKDRPPEVLTAIDAEIDSAPTMEEQAAAEAQQMRDRMQLSIQKNFVKDAPVTS